MVISGKVLARNTVFNLIGQGLPLLVGILTIPFVVQGLGKERFGLLSLAWVVVGYFIFFDIGLGRATTKYVAEALGRGEEDGIPNLVWTAVLTQGFFGVLGASLLFVLTPLLTETILNISPDLLKEAKTTFYLLALSIPVILVSGSFSGILEAAQRFGLVGAAKGLSSGLTFLLPWIGLELGFRLPGIVVLILVSRTITLSGLVALACHIFPGLLKFPTDFGRWSCLMTYGGWVALSNLIIPVFVYFDRFLIGSLLTLGAVTYYTVPYELVTKLLIFPASMANVLFPAFTIFASSGDKDRLSVSVARSIKYLITAMAPVILFLLIYADSILGVWLGDDFVLHSAGPFRLLTLGVFLNAIGQIPFALVQGVGRPDIVAKYHFIELPFYMGGTYFLISHFGINGAALAWCFRMMYTIPIFFVICMKVAGISLRTVLFNVTKRSSVSTAGLMMAILVFGLWSSWTGKNAGLLSYSFLPGYALFAWYFILDPFDKKFMKDLLCQSSRFLCERRRSFNA